MIATNAKRPLRINKTLTKLIQDTHKLRCQFSHGWHCRFWIFPAGPTVLDFCFRFFRFFNGWFEFDKTRRDARVACIHVGYMLQGKSSAGVRRGHTGCAASNPKGKCSAVSEHGCPARYFKLAAGQGLAQVQSSLRALYVTGDGVARDRVAACQWCVLAADCGSRPNGRLVQVCRRPRAQLICLLASERANRTY